MTAAAKRGERVRPKPLRCTESRSAVAAEAVEVGYLGRCGARRSAAGRCGAVRGRAGPSGAERSRAEPSGAEPPGGAPDRKSVV